LCHTFEGYWVFLKFLYYSIYLTTSNHLQNNLLNSLVAKGADKYSHCYVI